MKNLKNKYYSKLQEYIDKNEENQNSVLDMEYCAKLRKKAEELEFKKNVKLYDILNNKKTVNLDKIKYLLETGADVNAEFKDGLTPYMVAALNAQIDALEFLKQEGAVVEAKNSYGQNALMLACLIRDNYGNELRRKYMKVVKKLIEHGVGDKMDADKVGLTRDDYLMGKTEPFTKTYLQLIDAYMNVKDVESYVFKN